ncbi:MAG: MFS transporter [Patescibacteria group bacterium]
MNPIIKILIFADVFLFSGLGFMTPILAIFIKDNLPGGSIAAAGIASTVYLVTKAVLQIPLARWMDREPANVREFWTMIFGYLVVALIPFGYLVIRNVQDLYLLQVLHGIGAAIGYPGFMAIFTKFADHEKAAMSWSTYSTSVIIGMAITAAAGGWLGEAYGFATVFVVVGLFAALSFFSTLGLFLFYDQMKTNHPDKGKSFRERLASALRSQKHPIVPPGKLDIK